MKCKLWHWRRFKIDGLCANCLIDRLARAGAVSRHPAGRKR